MATSTLQTGTRYRATADLGGAGWLVSNDKIKSGVEGKGFINVTVVSADGKRIIEATWPKPPETMEVPSQVEKIEVLSSPAAASSVLAWDVLPGGAPAPSTSSSPINTTTLGWVAAVAAGLGLAFFVGVKTLAHAR